MSSSQDLQEIKKYRKKWKLWTEYVQGFCYSEIIK